jgi:foldase protein PrsA
MKGIVDRMNFKKKSPFMVKTAIACAVSATLLLSGCSGSAQSAQGVAATVNGEKIMEADITSYIEQLRDNQELTDDSAWAEYLETLNMTASDYREQIIEERIQDLLAIQLAEKEGISVEDSEIDSYVESAKSGFETDEDWQAALQKAGWTEEQYRTSLKASLLEQELMENAGSSDASDDDVIECLSLYSDYYGHAKRSSRIVFAADDTDNAQSVLSQINAGTLSFEDAVEQYSVESTDSEGDMGWDVLTAFSTAYTDALDALSVGEVSPLVQLDNGWCIIKCTDTFDMPDNLDSLDSVPSEIVEQIRSILSSSSSSTAYDNMVSEFRESSDITINDMPDDVSYNVEVNLDSDES